MLELKKKFNDAIIGLSDHSETIYTSLGAVSMGACVIEKHYVTTKKTKGPDVSSSMDFNELKELIKGSKIIYESKEGKKGPIKEEAKTIAFAFASVAAVKNIKKDEKLTSENIFPIRPSSGFYKVKDYKNLIGLRANRNIEKGSQLKPADVK